VAHLRIGGAVSRPRGESVRVPALRTPGGFVKRLGRALLWLLVLVLLLRGLASVLEPRDPAPAVPSSKPVAAPWPDDDARAFATEFARAYLSYSPRRPDASSLAVQALVSPELADSIAPEYDERARAQTVVGVTVARTTTLDARHALITVAATIEGADAPRYLTVPVARDAAGGLVVSDLPSFAAAPGRASLEQSASEPLSVTERAAIEPVVSHFLLAFLAGDASDLEYLAPAGVRIAAPALQYELVDMTSLSLAAPASGRERVVLAGVRARDRQGGRVFSLLYRLRLEKRDRWYVAAVNQRTGRGG
jgi:hypothetical protein